MRKPTTPLSTLVSEGLAEYEYTSTKAYLRERHKEAFLSYGFALQSGDKEFIAHCREFLVSATRDLNTYCETHHDFQQDSEMDRLEDEEFGLGFDEDQAFAHFLEEATWPNLSILHNVQF